jgi:hypothetical protein
MFHCCFTTNEYHSFHYDEISCFQPWETPGNGFRGFQFLKDHQDFQSKTIDHHETDHL